MLFLTLPESQMTLARICSLAEVELPEGWKVTVDGAEEFADAAGLLQLEKGAVLILGV